MSQARGHESHVGTSCPSLESYQTVVYDRALHPELFQLRGRRVLSHGKYDAELWLVPGGHMVRFGIGGHCCCELVTDVHHGLPEAGVVASFACAGEREYEHEFKGRGVRYMFVSQTESLTENLFEATYREMDEYARESDALSHHWNEGVLGSLSVLGVQRFAREIQVEAYHLLGREALVIRTQTVFEHA